MSGGKGLVHSGVRVKLAGGAHWDSLAKLSPEEVLTPRIRPQAARFRLDTLSLRGRFNQQIHGAALPARRPADDAPTRWSSSTWCCS